VQALDVPSGASDMALESGREEEAMTDQFPEKLGKYRIVEEVGRGGFADVYKAVDTTLDRTVALKFLEPRLLREPTFVERFQREAKLAANLKHPNIVFIHEFGWEAGTVYIAMEFLEGRTLKEVILQEGALPPRRIVNMVGQIASALDYAHGRGLVHRDIKPSNIMVGADDHVTVMDFGIAKAATLTALTTTGRIFGTPEYMSPEQAEGEEEPDARSDVYSLGVMVYEMFTDQVPFSGTTPLSIMRGHADKPPPSPSEVNPDVSSAVEAVLLRTLAKQREERYQSAGEMAVALQQAVGRAVAEEVKAPPPVAAPPPEAPSPEAERAQTLPPAVPVPIPARPALPWKWVAGIGAVVVVAVGLIALVSGGGPKVRSTPTPEAAALEPTFTSTTVPTKTPSPVPPSSTPLPPTPTDTPVPIPPPIDTPTPVPPTATSVLPTATPLPPTPSPTPYRGRIAFESSRDGNGEIYVMNADGSGQINLTNHPAWDAYVSDWSPDGMLITFPSNRDGNEEIYVMNGDGSGVTRLTNNPGLDFAPSWSPDGLRIAFVSNRDGNNEIYAMNGDGSGVTRLTNNPADDGGPSWSPDGTSMAFTSSRDGNEEIYVMNADGSGQTNLTNHPALDMDPSWSPDGTRIAFSSTRDDGNGEIYVMNADGSGQTRLTNNPAPDWYPSWGS
jgi:serine/threonine protein kinase